VTAFRPFAATVLSVHDGDTLRVLADLGFRVSATIDVRLAGCNAPELALPAGKAAKAWLAQLLPAGTPVAIVSHGPDKYGARWDCDVAILDGTDVVASGVTAGMLARWDGHGPRPVPVPAG
jgi:endonuclease YncB( thermonuclease family)